jgi:hypothetical protein
MGTAGVLDQKLIRLLDEGDRAPGRCRLERARPGWRPQGPVAGGPGGGRVV